MPIAHRAGERKVFKYSDFSENSEFSDNADRAMRAPQMAKMASLLLSSLVVGATSPKAGTTRTRGDEKH